MANDFLSVPIMYEMRDFDFETSFGTKYPSKPADFEGYFIAVESVPKTVVLGASSVGDYGIRGRQAPAVAGVLVDVGRREGSLIH